MSLLLNAFTEMNQCVRFFRTAVKNQVTSLLLYMYTRLFCSFLQQQFQMCLKSVCIYLYTINIKSFLNLMKGPAWTAVRDGDEAHCRRESITVSGLDERFLRLVFGLDLPFFEVLGLSSFIRDWRMLSSV